MRCSFSDLPFIMACLEQFYQEHPLHVEPDPNHVRQLLINIIAGQGLALRSEHGILLAVETPSVWNPECLELHELAFWVHPDYRGGLEGGRLLKEYSKISDSGRWAGVSIAQTPNTKMNFTKWGFQESFSVALKRNGM